MGIDKETKPNFINIVMDDNPKFIASMRKQANEDSQNDNLEEGESKKISLTMENGSFDMSEYYFEEADSSLMISGEITSENGKAWVSIDIPLSDTVLIDILEYSTKKLNKLKTALETLK